MSGPPIPPRPPAADPLSGGEPEALVGRDADLARVAALLETHQLVTVTGPAGVGKTALAHAIATRGVRDDGGCFIDLQPLQTLDDMLAAVASALYLPPAAVASPAALARSLRPLALRVVLDGADGLSSHVAAMVGPWPQHAPQVRLLVTGRQPLGLPGERVVPLAALSEAASRQLFARLLGGEPAAVGAEAVGRIGHWLGGLPLALQLAAAVARSEGVPAVFASLPAGLGEPSPTMTPARRLDEVVSWAHARLDPEAQRLLRRLGAFGGAAFSSSLAAAVCGDSLGPAAVVAALARLRAAAWVSGREDHLQLAPALGHAARSWLEAAGEAGGCRDAHLTATLGLWRGLFESTYADPLLAWAGRARDALPHLRQAMRHALADERSAAVAIELLSCTGLAWVRLGLRLEGRQWCDRVRPLLDMPRPPGLQAAYWLTVAAQGVYGFQYGDGETRAALARALPVLRAGSDRLRTTLALYLEVLLLDRAGRAAGAQPLVDEMASIEPASWEWNHCQPRRNAQALVDRASGRNAQYLAFCRTELAEQRRRSQAAESWTAAHHLALAEQDAGRPAMAIAALDEAYREICAHGAQRQFATLTALRAAMLAEQGDLPRLDAALDEALPVLQSVGTAWMLDDAWAWRALHAGRAADAARLLGRADRALQVRGSAQRSAYLQRSWLALRGRLDAALGATERQRLVASGASLDADGAQALAWGR